jgi:hypothetical protein
MKPREAQSCSFLWQSFSPPPVAARRRPATAGRALRGDPRELLLGAPLRVRRELEPGDVPFERPGHEPLCLRQRDSVAAQPGKRPDGCWRSRRFP